MTALVDLFSDPGETVLDATAGSGTTGVAAKRLGRKAILIERDEKHCESAATRLEGEVVMWTEAAPAEGTSAFDFEDIA